MSAVLRQAIRRSPRTQRRIDLARDVLGLLAVCVILGGLLLLLNALMQPHA